MKYHITDENGDIIASFKNEFDRWFCKEALEKCFPNKTYGRKNT